jgi:UDP-N-acetylglucosamine 2-epimerase (non-hydrolysing)
MAPVVQALRQHSEIQAMLCATGQHREMLDQVLRLFDIVPDIDLNLMRAGQTPSQVAARVLTKLEPVLQVDQPDWVLVQGDTTTVMAAAICAHHNRVRVGHVEAGLRSYDWANPFPEEMNRVVTDHISDLHFAPTQKARCNLLREGVSDNTIRVTGNSVIDALLRVAEQAWEPQDEGLLAIRENSKRVLLVTAHRRENHGEPLMSICAALKTLAGRGDVQIVYPVHLNPKVWGPVHVALNDVPGVTLLRPVDYQALVWLLKHCALVLTDSGGIQEEAPALGKPVLVLRKVTERPEGVEAGTARVVGTDPARIVAEVGRLLDDEAAYRSMAQATNPYGDGRASERIVSALVEASAV